MLRWLSGRSKTPIGTISVSTRSLTASAVQDAVKFNLEDRKTGAFPNTSLPPENGPHASGDGFSDSIMRTPRPYLPLSPLMDPVYIAAKTKHLRAKPPSPALEHQTPFQQKLENSPYAQALATEVRQCRITKVLLPRFFLQDFELVRHPETSKPWLLPRSLAPKTRKYSPESQPGVLSSSISNAQRPVVNITAEDTSQPQSQSQLQPERSTDIIKETTSHEGIVNASISESLNNTGDIQTSQDVVDLGIEPPQNPADSFSILEPEISKLRANHHRVGARTYSLSRATLLHSLDETGSGFLNNHKLLIPPQLLQINKKLANQVQIRRDMHDLVLELMRRRLRETLEDVLAKPGEVLESELENDPAADTAKERRAILALGDWKDVEEFRNAQNRAFDIGALLWTGLGGPSPAAENGNPESDFASNNERGGAPSDFASLDFLPAPAPRSGRRSGPPLSSDDDTVKVPVHNLPRLLGSKQLKKFFADIPEWATSEFLVLEHSRDTRQLQMALWRLAGYVFEWEDEAEAMMQE